MSHQRWLISVALAAMVLLPPPARAQTQQGKQAPKPAATVASGGYAGNGTCQQCHKKEYASFAGSAKGKLLLDHPRDDHEKLGCESCHGPSKQHVESGGEERGDMISFRRKNGSPVPVRNATCLSCHQKTARTLWKGSNHESRGVSCTDCHTVMHAVSERGNLKKESVSQTCGSCHQQQQKAQMRFSHMPLGEKKLECTSCHNPHGTANPKLLLASSTNQTCYTCHAEKRGPFMWQHPPVAENCATCHDPHGSSHEKMLKVSRPRLCQQCHAGATQHPGAPRPPNATAVQFVFNRQCQNCHVNIHGSNHPSGQVFTR